MTVADTQVVVSANGRAPWLRLWTAVALGYTALGATLQQLPNELPTRFGAGPAEISVVTGIAFLATAVTRPWAGWLADAGRARNVVTAGGALTTVAALGQMLAPDLGVLTAARLTMGAGEALLFSGAIPWVLAGVPADRRGRVAGRFGLSMWSGLALGPVVATGGRLTIDPGAVWWLVVGAGALSMLLARATPKPTPSPRPRAPGLTALVPKGSRLPGLYLGLVGYAYGAVVALLVLYLHHRELEAAAGLPVFGATFLAVRAVGSPLVDRCGAARVATLMAVLEASALAALPQTDNTLESLSAIAVAGAGVALAYPCASALTLSRTQAMEAGTAVGAMTSCWDLGLFAAGLACAPLVSHFGYPQAFLTAAGASLAALALAAMLREEPTRVQP